VRITARLWKQVVEADLALIAELNRAENELPNHANRTAMVASGHTRATMVAYEALLENTDSERRRLYEFLALDPSEARALAAEDLTLPGVPHERSDAFFRKGVQGDWKQYFHDDAKQWFKEEAGDLLERLGYVGQGRKLVSRPRAMSLLVLLCGEALRVNRAQQRLSLLLFPAMNKNNKQHQNDNNVSVNIARAHARALRVPHSPSIGSRSARRRSRASCSHSASRAPSTRRSSIGPGRRRARGDRALSSSSRPSGRLSSTAGVR
jgi:hypothetical protein